MSNDEVARLLAVTRVRYGTSTIWENDPRLLVEAWLMTLGDVTYADAADALAVWARTEKWAPDPSELRALVAAKRLNLPEPAAAWGLVVAKFKAFYPGQPSPLPPLPEPVARAVKDLGGLYTLKMSGDIARHREAFLAAYTIYRKRAMTDTRLDAPALAPRTLRAVS